MSAQTTTPPPKETGEERARRLKDHAERVRRAEKLLLAARRKIEEFGK